MNAEQFSKALGKVDDGYVMEAIAYRREQRAGWLRWGAMAACFGAILTAAMTVLPGIVEGPGCVAPPDPDVPGPVASDSDRPSADPVQPSGGQELVIDLDSVVVNEVAQLGPDAARRYYDPALYDEEIWGEEEIVAYYGWDLAPGYVPEGLSSGGNGPGGIMYREKATGAVVEDQGGRGFWVDLWEDGSPRSDDDIVIATGFTVKASRLGILNCCILPVDDAKTTDFGGVPVILSHCSLPHGPFDPTKRDPSGLYALPAGYYDVYVASFTLDGVEYEIQAQRLELEEVVKIVASVVEGRAKEGDAR